MFHCENERNRITTTPTSHLSERNCSTSGTKATLISRLSETIGSDEIEVEEDENEQVTAVTRNNYSVREIAETIPDFDPTNDSSLSEV
ncbi:uncharacterized protein LOC120781505 [Bactrocera tryoni]|uniref:uncharacterized protein LOC120781505 n=1 Tax=Bactrocera tryoni TaxID=59916 RepID=UPI001A959D0D|nr:uncharacterized protein LOC120781505 [Bactrocera tryoni]